MKCNTLGCNEEATRHSVVDIGCGLSALVHSCEKHYQETMEATLNVEKEMKN